MLLVNPTGVRLTFILCTRVLNAKGVALMELDIFVLDAFTDQQFKGNSAAVIPLQKWLKPELMLKIAQENNLSETAFIKHRGGLVYEIRWFSPLTEIDFCGHATLAASFVLFNHFDCRGEIRFETQEVGDLNVSQLSDGRIEMSFPNQKPVEINTVPQELIQGLKSEFVAIDTAPILRNRQAYFVVLPSEKAVQEIGYDSLLLAKLAPYDVVVTARSEKYDFVSRYFWPANGGDEDPVTGSIHAGLAPYWADQLNCSDLVAYQASQRGGRLYCRIEDERVYVAGEAILYLRGKICVA